MREQLKFREILTNYPNERSSKFARDKDEQEYTRKKRNTRTKQVTGDTNVTITGTVKVAWDSNVSHQQRGQLELWEILTTM